MVNMFDKDLVGHPMQRMNRSMDLNNYIYAVLLILNHRF